MRLLLLAAAGAGAATLFEAVFDSGAGGGTLRALPFFSGFSALSAFASRSGFGSSGSLPLRRSASPDGARSAISLPILALGDAQYPANCKNCRSVSRARGQEHAPASDDRGPRPRTIDRRAAPVHSHARGPRHPRVPGLRDHRALRARRMRRMQDAVRPDAARSPRAASAPSSSHASTPASSSAARAECNRRSQPSSSEDKSSACAAGSCRRSTSRNGRTRSGTRTTSRDLSGPSPEGQNPLPGRPIAGKSAHGRIGTEFTSSTKTQNGMVMDARGTRHHTLKTTVSPGHPLCATCRVPLEVMLEENGITRTRCPRCNDGATYGLPENAAATCAALRGVIAGEQRTDRPVARTTRGQSGALGVACPQCGAALAAGEGEMVKCTYCGITARVPGKLARRQIAGRAAQGGPVLGAARRPLARGARSSSAARARTTTTTTMTTTSRTRANAASPRTACRRGRIRTCSRRATARRRDRVRSRGIVIGISVAVVLLLGGARRGSRALPPGRRRAARDEAGSAEEGQTMTTALRLAAIHVYPLRALAASRSSARRRSPAVSATTGASCSSTRGQLRHAALASEARARHDRAPRDERRSRSARRAATPVEIPLSPGHDGRRAPGGAHLGRRRRGRRHPRPGRRAALGLPRGALLARLHAGRRRAPRRGALRRARRSRRASPTPTPISSPRRRRSPSSTHVSPSPCP